VDGPCQGGALALGIVAEAAISGSRCTFVEAFYVIPMRQRVAERLANAVATSATFLLLFPEKV
jgi:hypothetical protein